MCLDFPKVLILNRQRFNHAYKAVALMEPLLLKSSASPQLYLETAVNTLRLTTPFLVEFKTVLQKQKRCILTLQKILNVEQWTGQHVLHIIEQHTRDYVFVTIAVLEGLGYNKRSSYNYGDMDSCLYLIKTGLNKQLLAWPFAFMNPRGHIHRRDRAYSSSSNDESNYSSTSTSEDEAAYDRSAGIEGNTQILVDEE